jgi:hypothetical protein
MLKIKSSIYFRWPNYWSLNMEGETFAESVMDY